MAHSGGGRLKLKTFEKVVRSQKNLRKKLNDLIDDNRWLNGVEGEVQKYYSLLAWATVGVGDGEYESSWKGDTGEVFFQSYQRFMNKAGQVDEDTTFLDDRGNVIYAEAEQVWRNVKDAFLDKQGEALRRDFVQSPESEKRNPPKTKEY